LYHQALIKDANNIDLRYDVGQLYERLGLYPDALYTYLNLVDQLFPAKPRVRRRSARSRRDSFVIWYRYVIVLALGGPLARELLYPDWKELRGWLARAGHSDVGVQGEERPLRTIELLDIRRQLATRLREVYPSHTDPEKLEIPIGQLLEDPCTDGTLERRTAILERCLLKCAESEAGRLAHSMRWSIRRYLSLRQSTSLTLIAVRQAQVTIRYRLALLESNSGSDNGTAWVRTPDGVEAELRKVGYKPEKSTSWLEHYNAACNFALVMRDDAEEVEQHLPYAYAAVSALELALRYGEDIDFVRTKRYWLRRGIRISQACVATPVSGPLRRASTEYRCPPR
jgi:hypothetical protein